MTWIPSFDLNRVIWGAQLTAMVALISFGIGSAQERRHNSRTPAAIGKVRGVNEKIGRRSR